MSISFSAVYKWNFIFVCFLFTAENEKCFSSASSIHHKKVSVLVLRCKVLVLVLKKFKSLGLDLETKVLVLILVLKKVLIISRWGSCVRLRVHSISLILSLSIWLLASMS